MDDIPHTSYAVPCTDLVEEDSFLVFFNTKKESDAIKLAKCICGTDMAEKSLVIVDEQGEIWPLF